jgi:hypothetical protein
LRPVGYALSRSFSDLFAGSELTCHETRIFFNRLVPSICHSTAHHLLTTHFKYAPLSARHASSLGERIALSLFSWPLLLSTFGFSSPSLFISGIGCFNYHFPPPPWLQSRRPHPPAMMLAATMAHARVSSRSRPGWKFTEKPSTVCTRKTTQTRRLVTKSGRSLFTLMACISGTQHSTFGRNRHQVCVTQLYL